MLTIDVVTKRINKQIAENKKIITKFRADKKLSKSTDEKIKLNAAIYVCQFANQSLKNLLK